MFRKGRLWTLSVHFGPHFGVILEPSSLLYSFWVALVVNTAGTCLFYASEGQPQVLGGDGGGGSENTLLGPQWRRRKRRREISHTPDDPKGSADSGRLHRTLTIAHSFSIFVETMLSNTKSAQDIV